MLDEILLDAEERMIGAINALQREFSKVRTGRANPKLLNTVRVNYYGTETPINQLGGISVPEPTQLLIKPYDRSVVKEVEKAILAANLGITPQNEGDQIRIVLPQLNEERRKQLVKEVKKLTEDAKVAIRNIRRDANDHIKKLEKSGDVSEDDSKGYQEDVQTLTDQYIESADKALVEKENDLMHI
ncbi:ribosome recycling factor [Liberiplasma polymorphum]|uniref:ribosome recycling factor n=1 Tax=Liberiplasma polymorphum TaxID=3374570 RepID=UPI0037744F16